MRPVEDYQAVKSRETVRESLVHPSKDILIILESHEFNSPVRTVIAFAINGEGLGSSKQAAEGLILPKGLRDLRVNRAEMALKWVVYPMTCTVSTDPWTDPWVATIPPTRRELVFIFRVKDDYFEGQGDLLAVAQVFI
jgi:hypothetical protein